MRNPNTIQAYQYLRKKIVSGEFPPGSFLSAQSISKEIGVSRTPMREALRQLECEDMVTIVPKLGATVTNYSREEFQELLGFREALELYAVSRAATLRQAQHLAELQDIIENMRVETNRIVKTKKGAADLSELSNLDMRFHRVIFTAAGNQMVMERYERANILQRMMTLAVPRGSLPEDLTSKENIMSVFEEHVAIFEAIRDQDPDRARKAMARHIEILSAKYMRWMSALPETEATAPQEVFM